MIDYVVLFVRGGSIQYELITAHDEETARDKVYEMYGGDINVVDCWPECVEGYIEFTEPRGQENGTQVGSKMVR